MGCLHCDWTDLICDTCGESQAACDCDDPGFSDCPECGGLLDNEPSAPPKVRADICGECPFRRKGLAGWLGANNPESFISNAMTDVSVSCHLMVDQNQSRRNFLIAEANATRCRGAITFMRNLCKMPRDAQMAALVRSVPADRENVFSSPREFVEHHNKAKVKSWVLEKGKRDKKAKS